MQDDKTISYKGFDKDMKCRDFQYEMGGEYVHDGEVRACGSGFHACEYPLDVFKYYSPAGSKFALVEQSGETAREEGGDSKIASRKLKIVAELNIAGLVKAAIEYTTKRCLPIDPESPAQASGNYGAAQASGYQGAAQASGNCGAAQASGRHSTAKASGFYGKAKGVEGSALFLVYRDEQADGDDYGRILHARAAVVGRDGIKPDTYYTLDASGAIVEAE